jgi:hypothetical protein
MTAGNPRSIAIVLAALLVAVSGVAIAATTIVDDFNDGDMAEYQGNTGYAGTDSTTVKEGSHSGYLETDSTGSSKKIDSYTGLNDYPEAGDRIEYWSKFPNDTTATFRFGHSSDKGYTFRYEPAQNEINLDEWSYSMDNTTSANIPTDEWIRTVIDWGDNGLIVAKSYDKDGNKLGESSIRSTNRTEGGIRMKLTTSTSQVERWNFDDFTVTPLSEVDSEATDTSFDYTVGVCYEGNATFNHEGALAGWYLHPVVSGVVPGYAATPTDFTTFNAQSNTSRRVESGDTYDIDISTDRAFFHLDSVIVPSYILDAKFKPYDLFTFEPPFTTPTEKPQCGQSGAKQENRAPKVNFLADPDPPEVGTLTSFESTAFDPDGEIVSHDWYINGNSAGTGVTESRRFQEPGTHTVTLEVVDNDGEKSSITKTYYVGDGGSAQEVWLSWRPYVPSVSETIEFQANTLNPETADRYRWTIAGKTSVTSSSTTTGSFDTAGSYRVKVEVLDDNGQVTASYASNIRVGNRFRNMPPSTFFTWEPFAPSPGETVTLNADVTDSDGSVESLHWSLPGGGSASGESTSVSFAESGAYEVTLTAVDDDGDEGTYTTTIFVGGGGGGGGGSGGSGSGGGDTGGESGGDSGGDTGGTDNAPPSAFFDWEPTLPNAGTDVTFTADASDTDGSVASIDWTFEDGQTATGETVTRSFEEGFQTVSMDVTDDAGAVATYETTVDVGSGGAGAIEGPTAVGVCSVPGNGTENDGIKIEYFDPSYNTSTLTYELTHDGVTRSGTVDFTEPKGYFFGCVGTSDEAINVSDGQDETEWEVNGSYENGTEFSDSGSSSTSSFTFSGPGGEAAQGGLGGAIPGAGGAGGNLFPLLIAAAATGGGVYLRSRQTGQTVPETTVSAVRSIVNPITRLVRRLLP